MIYGQTQMTEDEAYDLFASNVVSGHACPNCEVEIKEPVRVRALGLRLFHCPSCKEYWFDIHEEA